MPPDRANNGPVGAALVVGGGIGGMQAALDLAESGIKVFLVDRKPAIGGVMSQLDKTFPTNDCAMCTMAPRLVEIGRHKDIEIITLADVETVSGEPGNFKVTLKKRASYVDERKCTGCGVCQDVCPIRVPDEYNRNLVATKAISRRYPQAVPNTFAIQKLGQAPCRCACPVGQKVPGYVALIRERRYEDAYHVIARDNPFPSVCGRVCRHYCEDECARGRLDDPVSIMNLKRFVADWAYQNEVTRRCPVTDRATGDVNRKRVAIVGAGPAGLTAARDLSDWGYAVAIFEALPEPGGMMRFGVPEFRLPRERLEWDIRNALSNDVRLETNRRIESVDALFRDGFAAVFIATGAHGGKRLPLSGSDLPDVHVGTELLRRIRMGDQVRLKGSVLVLGGGSVALDVGRTAIRLGARDVRLACLESRERLPANPWEVEEAEEEGVVVLPSRSFLEIVTRDGAVAGVRCVEVHFRGFAEDGRPDADVIEGTEHTIQADTVVFAVGQAPEIPFASEGIDLTNFGTIRVDEDTLATSRPGVFAGGDAVTGTKTIVDAIAAGHRGARSIDRYLKGGILRRAEPRLSKVELSDAEIARKVRSRQARHATPARSLGERRHSFAESRLGYVEEVALAEANRCLDCGICSECLLCQERCEAGAIDHEMPPDELRELTIGAVILAPGYEVFDAAAKEELGYGRYPNVINALEFERILSPSGPFAGAVVRPSDKKPPKRIGFIQCVGSRDAERDYCSSVCCMYATKEAIVAKEHVGDDLECDIFYMDVRAFGKGFEEYYLRAQSLGVNYIRCRPPAVRQIPETGNLLIEYLTEDERKAVREYELVVLSVGMQPPSEASRLAGTFGVELNELGFCMTHPFAPVESSRRGVYAAGPFTEPKDIPETVTQASAAASRVLSLLGDVRGTLVTPAAYPAERTVRDEPVRVGVFVCHCGSNIAGVVNVPDVVGYARTLPDVVHAENAVYACSNDSLELIKARIHEHDLNRVVVASCTPRTHEPLFRDTLREAGLNPYLFEMANIRDQCSWVHAREPVRATEKAQDLVRMAVAKARLLEELPRRSVPVEKAALVIGGGLAGMTAALELGSQGFEVYLVEQDVQLGGNLRHIRYLQSGDDPQTELQRLIRTVDAEDRIRVFLNARVEEVEGSVGSFRTKISVNGDVEEVQHGVVIVATGAAGYRPTEYLYGQDERVITQLELEERLASSSGWSARSNGGPPRTVVMIQCVGSRDAERPYCSRLCCAEAMKNALKIKDISPTTNVYVLYRDIRTYGFRERYYTEARRRGVAFIRYEPEEKPDVCRNGKALLVKVVDQTLKLPVEIAADLVVLSTGIVPGEGAESVAKLLKVPLTSDGFFLEAHMKLRPVDFATDGVFLCGLAHSAKGVEESLMQAQAAAARAAKLLSRDRIELEPTISELVVENCDGCAYCVDPCPFHAITLIEFVRKGSVKKIVEINEAVCKGCGCCQATCPKQGVVIKGFKLEQLRAQVHAALGAA